jgi:ADP-heptose:LPS heptosyltransferase
MPVPAVSSGKEAGFLLLFRRELCVHWTAMTLNPDRNKPLLLVVKLSSLGDLFHALPAVHNLKAELNAKIGWVTQPEYADLVRCFTDVDHVLTFPRRGFLQRCGPFLRELRSRRYEWAVDLQGLLKSGFAVRMARTGRRIGPSFHREGSRWLYDAVAGPRNRNRHAVDENLDVIRFLGLRVATPEFPVRFPGAPRNEPAPRIALFPCSRWASKNWPEERFAVAAARIRERTGGTVFLLGGASDRPACDRIAAASGGPAVNLAGQCSLVETGSLLRNMNLVVSNDSGPMHMAAALDVPVLALFGPTNPLRTGPHGPKHRVLLAKSPCAPCLSPVCPRPPQTCMSDIPVDAVVQASLEMLG